MKPIELAGLSVRIAGGDDGDGGGEGPVIVLLHGFGAPGDNLVSLWRVIEVPAGTRWLFPAAPLILQPAPFEALAWWMIDVDRFVSVTRQGGGDDLVRRVPLGIEKARERVIALLDAIETRLHPTKLVLGGFSQGAMLACDVALRTDRALAGVALLSGTLVAADEWAPLVRQRKGLPVFQSHGQSDGVLPFAFAEKLRDVLRDGGVDLTWLPFRGGHEIPDAVIRAMSQWLSTLLA